MKNKSKIPDVYSVKKTLCNFWFATPPETRNFAGKF